jgi:glycosyltransferase involved in cell wall biosynthesis
MSAPLSIVVAVHNVQPWVAECLQSVAGCAPEGTEVIVVDDGSTDESGRLCDEQATGRASWRVIHQSNAGLGAARNVGLAAATREWVGFVDGDDLLLPGYAELLVRARADNLDVVTGAVTRTDGGRSWQSGLHRRALQPLGDRARISHDHCLIFDTTAWNKIYRRELLARHGLTFPEGVLYEDLPLTIPALYYAGDVGVVHQPVYSWRTREHGLSITQRRHEIDNLRDRFAAVSAVDEFLDTHSLHELRVAHDDKVVRLDLPLYTAALPEADVHYRAEYLGFFNHVVDGLTPERRRLLPPTLRLYVELASAGRMDDLVRAVRGRRQTRAWAPDHRNRWQRARASYSVYGLERELGLVTTAQIARRAPVSTLKILLPDSVGRFFVTLRQRTRERQANAT